MSPFTGDAQWDPQGINGVYRWLSRVWDLAQPVPVTRTVTQPAAEELRRAVHKTIKRVTPDLEGFEFNTAVSALMELSNTMQRLRTDLEGTDTWAWAMATMLVVMAPITPHITEELWHRRGNEESIHLQSWPQFDDAMTVDEVVTIVVQVNGKLRDRLEMPRGTEMESVQEEALARPKVLAFTEGKEVVKVIAVPDKLVNIVVR
jgi:leucyl-tRNA synthetase